VHIVRKSESVAKVLDGEVRTQYFGPQIRFGITTLPPSRQQTLHSHKSLTESIYVLSGEVEVYEQDGAQIRQIKLVEGDFVTFPPGPAHALGNTSNAPAAVAVVKLAFNSGLDDETFRQMCATDWIALG
jgi:quercetin dioxygenase-like cupin family protein